MPALTSNMATPMIHDLSAKSVSERRFTAALRCQQSIDDLKMNAAVTSKSSGFDAAFLTALSLSFRPCRRGVFNYSQ